MKIQGIIFDFNGTMFFDSAYHELAWKQISKELRGIEMSEEELATQMHGKNNEKILDYLSNGSLTDQEKRTWSLKKEAMYRNLCLENPATFHLAAGVEDVLYLLQKQRLPFAIASASIKENIDFFVEHFQLQRWFVPSMIVYDDGSYPDKVSMFQEAARRMQVDIHSTLIFEDSISGIRFAQEATAGGIIAIHSSNYKERYAQFPSVLQVLPDFTAFDFRALLKKKSK